MAFQLTVDPVLLAVVAMLLAGPTPAHALPPEPPLLLLEDEPRASPRPHVPENLTFMEAVTDWTPRMKRAYMREQRAAHRFDGYEDVAERAQKQTGEQQQQQRTGYGVVLPSPSPSRSPTPSSEVYGTKSWSYDSWWKEPISEADFSYSEPTEQPDTDTDRAATDPEHNSIFEI